MAALTHFTHEHPLGIVSVADEFICDGCNTLGSGERYHCQFCLFDLHNECAMSPANISSHLHPIHQLDLVWEKQEDAAAFFGHRPCNVCDEQVSGLYFACPVLLCDFVLHPICSEVPAFVHHVMDTQHPLTFQYAIESECKICRGNCTGWRYRCGPCHIDIHLECLLSPPSSPPPPTNFHEFRSQSLGHDQWKERRPLDHQYRPHAAAIPVGMQSSTSSVPSLYGLHGHHSHSFNCSQHIPYYKPGGDGSTGNAVGMLHSSPSYGASSSQQYYPQPFNNDHGPCKPDGSGHHHHGSSGGSKRGRKRKKMYAIVKTTLAAIVTHADKLSPPIEAEAEAFLLGLQLATDLHLTNIIIEGDAKVIVDCINDSLIHHPGRIQNAIQRCKEALEQRSDLTFSFSPRITNDVAHALAKFSITYNVTNVLSGDLPPPFVLDPLFSDLAFIVSTNNQ